MSKTPLVSVITAAYNSEATIGRMLKSLADQSNTDFESIVIDGASTDRTPEIVSEYKGLVHRFFSEPDEGIYHAMNKGIALARGEYIAFLNSDDAYLPHTIEAVSQAAGTADILYGNIRKERVLDGDTLSRIEKPALDRMPHTMGIFHPATFISRQLFEKHGGYDLRFKLAADYHWLLRAYLDRNLFEYIDRELAVFSTGGISNLSCESYREAAEIQREMNLSHHPEMLREYDRCLAKAKKQRIIAMFARLPIFRSVYKSMVKKRWS
ncbi:MAG: glycosyltransferase family 2 protein [Cryomorphaceae bacterium]|nr:glycosyltransferase [Flavobacteriales bacterium]